jgi:hypothetical protein
MDSLEKSDAASSRLTDLAIRINAEHKAASEALTQGLQRAIAAGRLLIEAKAAIPHGEWLSWLASNCAVSERTAQAYMRVAKGFAGIDETKSAAVADLSFRDALNSLAVASSIVKQLPAESFDRALHFADDHQAAPTWRRAVNRAAIADRRRHTMETPQAMLPSPTGRKIRVARNPTCRKWMLAVGPDISQATLQQREQIARDDEPIRALQQHHDGLLERAAELEAEAKQLRKNAETARCEINGAIRKRVGPAAPFTETYDFQCDETTDVELAALAQEQLVDRLLAARGSATGTLVEINRAYWGDIKLMGYQPPQSGPGTWTNVGSPEWLDEIFPNWNEPEKDAASAAAT